MPQYFLTVPHDSADEPTMDSMDPAELERVIAAVDQLNSELKEAGAFIHAAGLYPPSTVVTIDGTTGEPVRLDEPFVQADAYVGGFWFIEAADQDAAIAWTEKVALALGGKIEVREAQ